MSAQPPFPAAVRVGYRDYAVVELAAEDVDDHAVYGKHSGHTRRIYVSRCRGPAETAYLLVHEVLHAVWRMAGADEVSAPSEEHVATFAAGGLTAVMQANPVLRAWLAWAWGQEP